MADYSLGTAHGTVVIDSDTRGVDQANQSLDNIQKKSDNVGAAADKVGNKMGLAGLAIAGGLGVAVKTAGDFEQVLSNVGAVSGATGDQMQAIHDKALQIGKDTAFGATEAASAMEELAKAGIPIPDILNGAADATVALAAAGGVDMPTAATIASNAMNQFGLSAKDMTNTVNLIAGAANASAIDVTDFGQSMAQVGAVAHLAGMGFDDTAVAIAEMGNAGIKGSDAGTSLKTMLQNLVPQTKQQTQVMKELGLMTEDGTNKFFDQNGKLKSLKDIQGLLNDSTKGLSAEQKTLALQTLFGSDAIRAAAVMADQGAAGFDKMNNSMRETSAADVAKKRMDNMKGSIEQMKGSLETAAISIGETLIPYIKDLANALGAVFDWFNSLSPGVKSVTVAILAGAAAFLLIGSATIKVVRGFQEIFSSISTLIGWIFRKNAAEVESAAVSEGSALRSAAAWVASAVKTVAQWALMAAQATVHAVAVAAAWVAQSVATAASTAAAWVSAAATTIARWVAMAAAATANAAVIAAQWLVANGPGIATAVASFVAAVATTVGGWIAMAAQAVISAVIIAAQWLIAFWPVALIIAIVAAVIAAIIIFWDQIVAAFKTGAAWVGDAMSTAWNWVKQAWDWIVQRFTDAWNWIVNIFENIKNAVANAWDWIVQKFQMVAEAMRQALQMMWQFVVDTWNNIIGFFKQIPGWIGGIFSSAWNWLVDAGRGILSGLWNGITSAWNGLWGWIRNIPSWIGSIFSGAASWLWNAGSQLLSGLWNGITSAAGWLWNKIVGWAKGLVNGILGFFGIHSPSRVFADIGKNLMLGLGGGIDDHAKHAVAAAKGAAEDVLAAMTDGSVAALTGPGVSIGSTAATAGTGLRPVVGVGAGATPGALAAAGIPGKTVNIEMNTFNPVAEKASDQEARRLRAAAAVGAF